MQQELQKYWVFSDLKQARSPDLLFFWKTKQMKKHTHTKKTQHLFFFWRRLGPINEMLMPLWAPEKLKTCKPQILVHSNLFAVFSLLSLSLKYCGKNGFINMFYNYMLLHYNNLKRTGVTYHSWSSCMWRKRFRYSLGSSNWEGMGNIDS